MVKLCVSGEKGVYVGGEVCVSGEKCVYVGGEVCVCRVRKVCQCRMLCEW